MYIDFSDFKEEVIGKEFSEVRVDLDADEIHFVVKDGSTFKMYHQQDCCEHVWIEDIVGDIEDLVDSKLNLVDEATNSNVDGDYESSTWTFYRFGTMKGYVTLRWCGQSNGYYSESVNFFKYQDFES